MEVTLCSALGVTRVYLPLMGRWDSRTHYFVCCSGYQSLFALCQSFQGKIHCSAFRWRNAAKCKTIAPW